MIVQIYIFINFKKLKSRNNIQCYINRVVSYNISFVFNIFLIFLKHNHNPVYLNVLLNFFFLALKILNNQLSVGLSYSQIKQILIACLK